MEICKAINYRIPAPTSHEFIKYYLKQVLNVGIQENLIPRVTIKRSTCCQY